MWPMFVDYSDLECRQTLRSLELDAYASIVNAFRAQGALTEDKKTMLNELSSALSIPVERHKAEMRRVANDEHLNTVAERLYGPYNNIEWAKEGRRLKPLRPCPSCNEDIRKFAAKVRQGEHNEDSDSDDDELDLSDGAGARQVRSIFEAIMGHKRVYPFSYDEAIPSKVTVHSNPVTDQPGPSGFKSSTSDVPVTAAALSDKSLFMPHSSPQASSSAAFKIPPSPACAASTAASVETSREQEVVNCSSTTSMSAAAASMVATSTVSAAIDGNGSLLVTKGKPSDPVLSINAEEKSSVSPAKPTVNDSQVTAASSSLLKTLAMVALSAKTYTPSAATDSSVLTGVTVSKSEVASKSASKGQILPSHVGLVPSPQVSVRPKVLSLTPRIKAHDLSTIPKVAPVLLSTSVSQASRSLPASSQSQPEFKVPFPVHHKPLAAKSHQIKIQTLPNTHSGAKASALPGNVNQKPQLVASSFFPAFSKSGSKASGPIIACVPLRVPSTTSKAQADRPTIQILPKTATVGIIRNPIKMGTSSIRTVQQKEGGVVKTAHIVNISPSGGSRQQSTSSSGLATTGLCVTLPSGTRKALAVRASSPSKPNVIVVHKAQWAQPKVVSTPAAASKPSDAEKTEKKFIASIEETEICDGGLSLKFPIKEEIIED